MPLVSIIVPVYNRERSILFCLNSLANMNCQDFEVIVVDDGSTDQSATLCDNFCSSHSKFRCIHQSNGGVSSARNHALQNARGKWVTFVDSDDAVRPEHLDALVHEHLSGADLIVTAFTMLGTVNGEFTIDALSGWTEHRRESVQVVRYMFTDFSPCRNPLFATWSKFFKLTICRKYNIKFNESLSLDEDQLFVSSYLRYATHVVHYPEARTYLFLDWGGEHMSGVVHRPEVYLTGLDANYAAFGELYGKGGEDVKNYAQHYYVGNIVRRIVMNYTCYRHSKKLKRHELKNFVADQLVKRFASIAQDDIVVTLNISQPMVRLFRLIKAGHISRALFYAKWLNLKKAIEFKLNKISQFY